MTRIKALVSRHWEETKESWSEPRVKVVSAIVAVLWAVNAVLYF